MKKDMTETYARVLSCFARFYFAGTLRSLYLTSESRLHPNLAVKGGALVGYHPDAAKCRQNGQIYIRCGHALSLPHDL